MAIEKAELESVFRKLRRLGYDEAVFTFDYAVSRNLPGSDRPGMVDVVVGNTANRTLRTYRAAPGPWQSRFSHDLRDGVFGPPPRGTLM